MNLVMSVLETEPKESSVEPRLLSRKRVCRACFQEES